MLRRGISNAYRIFLEYESKKSSLRRKSLSCSKDTLIIINIQLIEDLSNKHTTLWSWGSNRFGQLGQGNQIKKSMPKPINYILGYTNSEVVEVS
jgi:hypothetical protein